MKKILYIDMDGVINLFESDVNARKNMWNKGYFTLIKPRDNIENDLIKISNFVDRIIILTKCIEREGVQKEKGEFIVKWLSHVPKLSVIYVPYDESKRNYISKNVYSILLDDSVKNIEECKNKCNKCVLFDEYDNHTYKNKISKVIDVIKYIDSK